MWSGLYSLVPWPHFSVAVHCLDYSHCEQEALDSELWAVYHSTANVSNLGNVQFDAKWNQLESTGWDCHHNLVGWGTFLGLRTELLLALIWKINEYKLILSPVYRNLSGLHWYANCCSEAPANLFRKFLCSCVKCLVKTALRKAKVLVWAIVLF